METGDAESTNEATVEVEQTQDVDDHQLDRAEHRGRRRHGDGWWRHCFAAGLPGRRVGDDHQQRRAGRRLDVIVAQGADSNTGGNEQENVTLQGNLLKQDADADANGGDADAYTGGGGEVEADGVVVAAASVETVADALGGDGGEAVAVNDAEQDNSSESSNEMVTGDATSENSADVSVGQDQSAEITNEVEQELAGG